MSDQQDKKPEETVTKATVEELMSKALQDGIAKGIAMAATMQPQAPAVQAAPVRNRRRCADCGQKNMACGGRHKLVCLWPRDQRFARVWSGVKLNGVRYASNGPGHMIMVPEDSNLEYLMAHAEQQEIQAMDGRRFSRNSGSISQQGGSNNFNAYQGGDFGKRVG